MNIIDKHSHIFKSTLNNIGVSRISEISGYEDVQIYVYQSIRPTSNHLIVDSGKGKTRDIAYISCCVEAIERFTAENHNNIIHNIPVNLIKEPIKLKLINGLSPKMIDCYSGFNLSTPNETVYLPVDLIKYENDTTNSLYIRLFRSGTTGLGSHTNEDSAIYSGVMEILERDALASNSMVEIVPESIPKVLHHYIRWINNINTKFKIFFHKSNHPIFVFSLVSYDKEMYGGLIGMGSGLTPMEGIESALIESIQTWLMRVSGSRDDWCFAKTNFSFNSLKSDQLNFKEIVNGNNKLSNKEDIFKYLKESQIPIFAVKLNPTVPTTPILTYKVILPTLNDLQQGHMFTGVPRANLHTL